MYLKSNHEIVGVLVDIKQHDNNLHLKFMTRKEIEIPQEALSYDKLKSLKGNQIGLFNYDGSYKIREIK